MATNQKDFERKIKFNLEHRVEKSRQFRKLSKKEEAFFQKKLKEFERLSLAQFEQGAARPRLWHGKWPGTVPLKVSRERHLYRINFGRKMRVFAFVNALERDNEFWVIWVDATHKSG